MLDMIHGVNLGKAVSQTGAAADTACGDWSVSAENTNVYMQPRRDLNTPPGAHELLSPVVKLYGSSGCISPWALSTTCGTRRGLLPLTGAPLSPGKVEPGLDESTTNQTHERALGRQLQLTPKLWAAADLAAQE